MIAVGDLAAGDSCRASSGSPWERGLSTSTVQRAFQMFRDWGVVDGQCQGDTAEDPYRVVTDADLRAVEDSHQRNADTRAGDAAQPAADRSDQPTARDAGMRDIREVAAGEPAQGDEDAVRVPTAAETAEADVRAGRSIAEFRARRAEEEREADQERAAELNRWHDQDHATDTDRVDVDGYDDVDLDDAVGYAREPDQ